ncbi:uncharacterized protein GLRG_09042 [Colletotrichum graminicola M1.001]|uniref:Uncharacterized protein n=1 Tax=Colletotrichum graminicola (strain M1.001 / M2 / FGSC 10212) TaxID=645133 RepID=E3QSR0_COLGM|nr:uncharacterized protein GLRG_09042 [Colletotrichum graminicola M1.001]EFQ33898.1 hypothetical protein GLRG_09042 [Colletotrichum graminicola M1.001]
MPSMTNQEPIEHRLLLSITGGNTGETKDVNRCTKIFAQAGADSQQFRNLF